MGRKPDLGPEAQALKDLIREAHEAAQNARGAAKDLRAAVAEARRTAPEIVGEQIEKALADGLAELGERTQEAMRESVAKVIAEFDRLSDVLMGRTAEDEAEGKTSIPELVETVADLRTLDGNIVTADGETASFTCINPRCRARLDDHDARDTLPPGGRASDTRALTICMRCCTVIAIGPDGPREPTDAERAVVEATDVHREMRALNDSLTAAARRLTAHLNGGWS